MFSYFKDNKLFTNDKMIFTWARPSLSSHWIHDVPFSFQWRKTPTNEYEQTLPFLLNEFIWFLFISMTKILINKYEQTLPSLLSELVSSFIISRSWILQLYTKNSLSEHPLPFLSVAPSLSASTRPPELRVRQWKNPSQIFVYSLRGVLGGARGPPARGPTPGNTRRRVITHQR